VAFHHDLRLALRALWRTPGFTAVVVLCLALGTGANTAIFSLLDQVLLRSLPVRDPERLVVLHGPGRLPGSASADNMETVFSVPMFHDIRDRTRVFDGVIARLGMGVTLTGGEAERAAAELVSGDFFNVLGVRPQIGRVIEPADDQSHAPHAVAVLGYAFWMRRYGGSASALNSTLRVNGVSVTVVGVAARGFSGVLRGNDVPEMFLPLGMHGQLAPALAGWAEDRSTRFLNVFARLQPGESREHAVAGLRAVYEPIVADELSHFQRLTARERQDLLRDQIALIPAAEGINMLREEWERPILALAAIAGLVLLIACANISGLILARAASREKDIAVRLALGAGRFAVGRPFLFESLTVSVAGACLGLAVSHWSIAGLLWLMPGAAQGYGFLSAAVDSPMLLFSLTIAVLAGILSGLAPMIQASRQNIGVSLSSQTRSATAHRTVLRRALVAGQIALCLVLLVAAGLLTGTLYNIARVDIGFQPAGVTVFQISAADSGYHLARSREFYRQVDDRLAALPGVQSVASSLLGPYMNGSNGTNVFIDGFAERPGQDVGSLTDCLSASYFSTLGTPLVAGREFTVADRDDAPLIAMVNEAFARAYLGASVLGRRIRFSPRSPWKEIVGVARNTAWNNAQEKPSPFAYVPISQVTQELGSLEWYVRARPGYHPAADIRRVIHDLDPNVPVNALEEYSVKVAEAAYLQRLLAILASVFGGLATLLAGLGLYGLIAWTFAQRTAEIGIRMALGATRANIIALIAREAGTPVLFGVVPGIIVALAAGALIGSQVFGLSAHDPLVFGAAALVLVAVAALAAVLPALRAARTEPADALRCE
jgi:predicted permease